MTDAKPRPLFWFAAFMGLEALVVGLVFYLVGVVSGLQRQAVLVLAGAVVFAAVWWLLGRVEAKPDVRAGEQGPMPVEDIYWILVTQLVTVIWLIYGLNVNSVGERMWWLCAVGLPFGVGLITYHLVDLYRHRHEHARQREEKWAPWG